MTPSQRSLLSAALALVLAACQTQRFPGPMEPVVRPLPAGDIPAPPYGPQEILVFRLSDPVMVRRAGENTGFPLTVYEKRERLRSGAAVLCAAGGRAELLWPEDTSSVMLFDEAVCVLGEPSRDEPMVTFRTVTRSRLLLTPEDRVGLMGGAVLWGDPEESSGPFLVERIRPSLLRVTNQSKRSCTVGFRDEELLVAPGETVHLPILEAGSAPFLHDPQETALRVLGRDLGAVGPVEAGPRGLRAQGEASVRDRGLVYRLEAGDELILDVFGAEAEPQPEPEPDPVPNPPPSAGAEGAEEPQGGSGDRSM